jgi:hypothetical protein
MSGLMRIRTALVMTAMVLLSAAAPRRSFRIQFGQPRSRTLLKSPAQDSMPLSQNI